MAQTPITLGHEPAGTVEAIGEGVDGIEPGQRVVVRAGSSCGRCAACRAGRAALCERSQVLGMHIDGGLAELLLVNATELLPVPDAVPLEQAAIIGDAVATPSPALAGRGGRRPRPQARRDAVLARHPAKGGSDVACARAVGADDGGHAGAEQEVGTVGEALEALDGKLLEVHG